jgi:Putative zinc dependent peptidase (DUF5700)
MKLTAVPLRVGYRMALLVGNRYGRGALIECMLDRRLLLARYNQAAEELNAQAQTTWHFGPGGAERSDAG